METLLEREGVTEDTALRLLELQPRCLICGSTCMLQIHHRIFRSEGEQVLRKFLEEMRVFYQRAYGRILTPWGLNDIQQLCVLCGGHHEAGKIGVHGGNEKLHQFLRHSFTCPVTGFNIPFHKIKQLF